MKKLYLFLVLICFAFTHHLFAQEEKHIQVVVQSGGNHEFEDCVTPNKYGEISMQVSNVDIVAHFYQEALDEEGCDPLKLIVRNANDHSVIYASQTFTPEMANPLPDDDSGILCPEAYYHFSPNFTFMVPAPCGPDGEGTLYLEVVLDYDFNSPCAEIIFPAECYPDDSTDHHDHIHYEYIIAQTIPYICCSDLDTLLEDDGGFEPRKIATPIDAFTINLSPNPFQDQFTLTSNAVAEGTVQMSIYNSNNRLVHTQKEVQGIGQNQYLLDAAQLSDGFYYLKVESGDQVVIKRLVKIQ